MTGAGRCLVLSALMMPLVAAPAAAVSERGIRIAQAVALLDVSETYCKDRITTDDTVKATLMTHFHEYDIAGLASVLSRPLNAFYEDYSLEAQRDSAAFCRAAPAEAAATGYPVISAGQP
jgi:hypothetical protein